MSLSIGTRLGAYEILALLGAGGMGEVYRARDMRLGRVVAIKVLPDAKEVHREHQERFEREARAASRLNHPHICALYDVGEQDGRHFLVMEYMEGETLAERIERGKLRLEDAVRYAREMAEALDHAHRNGVVHRDLKPGNVVVTRSGAKVLDFGLARLWEGAPGSVMDSRSPTNVRELTEEGAILGTLPYMAPEQLEGKETDARTDLFALGAVTYEMVTGRRPFEGSSRASLIAAILSTEPPAIAESTSVPRALERVIGKCLAKDPERRWQTARDLADELTWILDPDASEPVVLRRKSSAFVAAVVSVLLLGLVGLAAILWTSEPSAPRSLVRSVIPIAPADSLVLESAATSLAISPDGRNVVYSGSRAGLTTLYVRALDRLEAVPIPGTEGGWDPFFSPDGRWLGFHADGNTKKISLTGGAPVTVCYGCEGFGASWSSDDTIVLGAHFRGLNGVLASGGDQRQLTAADQERGERSLRFPEVLPGGKAVVFTAGGWDEDTFDDARIEVLSLATGEKKVLIEGGSYARYASTGHLVYSRAGSLFAVAFDVARLATTGAPVVVLERVATHPNNGEAQFAISSEGTLVYAPGGPMRVHHQLVWVDRKGRVEPVSEITAALDSPRLSPNGDRIALRVEGAVAHLAVYDLQRNTLTRLTFEENVPSHAVWTPDGTRLTYTWQRSGAMRLFWQSADGSGAPEELKQEGFPGSWSPDGRVLAFARSDARFENDIWILPFEGDRTPQPLIEGRADQLDAEISPDGRWIAYVSDESGRTEVYMREFPGLGQKTQISGNGGFYPRWSRDSRELFYIQGEDKLMVSEIRTEPTLGATRAAIAFEDKERRYLKLGYDVAPDGRFLLVDENETWPRQLNLVQNWFAELERLVPVK